MNVPAKPKSAPARLLGRSLAREGAGLGPFEGAGRRARNKLDKLSRIRSAARELFLEGGYDGTTMRAIAARAGVGFGTLFDYASSKRDLLFLILNPELVAALESGYAAARLETTFTRQIVAIFRSFYELYHSEPTLSRYILREMNFYNDGSEAEKFLMQRADFIDKVTLLVVKGQERGEILPNVPPTAVAQIFFSIFAWEVRRWISGEPLDLDEGLASLQRLVDLQARGFLRTD